MAREVVSGEKARADAVTAIDPVSADRRVFDNDPDNRDSGKRAGERQIARGGCSALGEPPAGLWSGVTPGRAVRSKPLRLPTEVGSLFPVAEPVHARRASKRLFARGAGMLARLLDKRSSHALRVVGLLEKRVIRTTILVHRFR